MFNILDAVPNHLCTYECSSDITNNCFTFTGIQLSAAGNSIANINVTLIYCDDINDLWLILFLFGGIAFLCICILLYKFMRVSYISYDCKKKRDDTITPMEIIKNHNFELLSVSASKETK